jgi:hypothetical protein
LQDDRHFLYHRNSTTSENAGLYLGSVDSKPEQQNVKRLLATGNIPIYSPSQDPRTGYVLFLREGTLMSQGFDNRKLELTGEAVPVAEGVGNYFTQGFFSASATGVLVFRSGGTGGNRQYTWFDRQGKNLGAALEPGLYSALSLSPDGIQVAGDRQIEGAQQDIWLLQLASRVSTQFTFDPALDDNPIWSPDSSHVAFSSGRDGGRDLYQKVSTGAGKDELLLKSPELKVPKDWSRDGKFRST